MPGLPCQRPEPPVARLPLPGLYPYGVSDRAAPQVGCVVRDLEHLYDVRATRISDRVEGEVEVLDLRVRYLIAQRLEPARHVRARAEHVDAAQLVARKVKVRDAAPAQRGRERAAAGVTQPVAAQVEPA